MSHLRSLFDTVRQGWIALAYDVRRAFNNAGPVSGIDPDIPAMLVRTIIAGTYRDYQVIRSAVTPEGCAVPPELKF